MPAEFKSASEQLSSLQSDFVGLRIRLDAYEALVREHPPQHKATCHLNSPAILKRWCTCGLTPALAHARGEQRDG